MGEINAGRWTAEAEGDFVVFLIGARLNRPSRVVKAVRAISGMKGMLDYLTEHPEKGLLGYQLGFPTIVQYWRSFGHLEAFARDEHDPHLEAWRRYVRLVGRTGEAGVWHETFKVRAGEYEAIYSHMPAYGLAKATRAVPVVVKGDTAAERLAALAARRASAGRATAVDPAPLGEVPSVGA